MRYDAPYLVKRYGPMIGRPESARRISTAAQEYSVFEALSAAADLTMTSPRPSSRASRSAFWIEKRGQPATRTR
jgi:hypothetical protein